LTELATVTKQEVRPFGRGTPHEYVTVKLRGKESTFDFNGYLPDISEMQPGQKVRVQYRVGKSGEVYIEAIGPADQSASSRTTLSLPPQPD
jgi:hypothetical protein